MNYDELKKATFSAALENTWKIKLRETPDLIKIYFFYFFRWVENVFGFESKINAKKMQFGLVKCV